MNELKLWLFKKCAYIFIKKNVTNNIKNYIHIFLNNRCFNNKLISNMFKIKTMNKPI